MKPIDFEGTNVELVKPDDMTDEQCGPLTALFGEDLETARPCFITAWQPSNDDLKAINEGKPIYLKTIGKSFAPALLFTLTDDHKINS